MNLTTATPLEIDTALADLYAEESRTTLVLANAWDALHYSVDDTRGLQRGQRSVWYLSDHDAEEKAQRLAEEVIGFGPRRCISALERVNVARDLLTQIREGVLPLNDEFTRRGGWTRAFLVVTNGTGHVHSSMNCSTCYPSTQFVWMVDYAAKDESEIVEAAGERACTICYPHAPVDTRNRPSGMFTPDEIIAQAAREARAAAKVAREQTKIAKSLTTDGSEFRVEYVWSVTNGKEYMHRESFKTEAAASQWVVGKIADGYTITTSERAAMNTILSAMADKHDTSVEEIQADVDRKVAAKIKRDSRY